MAIPLLVTLLLLIAIPGFAVMVGLGLLVFVPAYLIVSSALTLVFAPQQILAVAFNRKIRRIHACEHATVNVLEEWFGPLPGVGGIATKSGFYIWGAEDFDLGTLFRAAQTGLARMKRGEKDLAIHQRCGTSLVITHIVFAAVFLLALALTGFFTLEGIILALVASWLFGHRLGIVVERYLTTSPDVQSIDIEQITWEPRPQVEVMPVAVGRGAYFFRTEALS